MKSVLQRFTRHYVHLVTVYCDLQCCALKAFKHAKQMADAEAAQRKTPVKLASADEIRRVLNAKTDYDCLQVNLIAWFKDATTHVVCSEVRGLLDPASHLPGVST